MKNLSLLLFIALLCPLITFSENNEEILRGRAANEVFKGSEIVRIKGYTAIPNYIKFSTGKEIHIKQLEQWLNKLYKTEKDAYSLELLGTSEDQLGFTHYKYQQVYKGIILEHAVLNAHTKNGLIISLNGEFVDQVTTETSPSITEAQALQLAKDFVGAKSYKWELQKEEDFLKWEQNDPHATFKPNAEMLLIDENIVFSDGLNLKLVYKFDIYAHEPLSRQEVYVDAKTGEIIHVNDKIHTGDTPGTATTGYSGQQNIVADSFSGGYRLRESGRGNGVETYDLNNSTSHSSAVDFVDSDNNWTTPFNPALDQYALDAHWGSEMIYDYFFQEHGRNSIDDNGFTLKSYVHYSTNYFNAFWDGSRMTYGDGGNPAGTTPLTSMVIAAHEITHGLTNFTADLVYSYESGALNESFSDIFGASVDFWARPNNADWVLGDEIGYVIRNMQNPNAESDPDTYQGTYWHTSSSDNGGVHTNSGVQNFWYYLLVTGGSGTNDNGDNYTVNGIGLTDASKIAFRNLTVYLGPNSQYSDARFYAIQSAQDLYGPCSPEVAATTNAWYAVGVGNAYTGGAVADFSADETDGCVVPFTVNFTNLGSNANSYSWDFGDGNTSTQQNPTHTYNAVGQYTVTLIALGGGTCGNDTMIKTQYIDIDTTIACPVTLPNGGTAPTQTACNGTLIDDGGLAGDYSNNQTTTVTINPPGATSVELTFNVFDIEPGSGSGSHPCDYDYLEIYDGPSTSSPVIDKYCNSNTPPTTISSTGGPITLKLYSDTYVEGAGFEIDWACSTGVVPPPIANFSADDTLVCEGATVHFTNGSVNGSTYQWSFPGGSPSTSNLQNPTVIYNNHGTYNVTLIANNANGSDVITKTGYIVVDSTLACAIILPTNTTLPDLTTCNGILYDDGGPSGDYSQNSDSYVTIAPANATSIDFWFNSFGMEGDSGTTVPCGWDFIQVFDGPNTNSPVIDKWCGDNIPSGTYSSTGGSITIYFHSDQLIVDTGFEFEWSCNTSGGGGLPPAADFTANNTTICPGQTVNFTDLSSNATSWNWAFNGGTPGSSTSQNPTVTYNTPGTYAVTLQATNSAGTDIELKQGFITVNAAPNASFVANSNNLIASFFDGSANTTSWSWAFGDGNSSAVQNPTHTYAASGTYNVCLTASNTNGCPNSTTCMNVTVQDSSGTGGGLPPTANMALSANSVCQGNQINFYDQSANNPTSWQWTFQGGTPATSNQQNPVVSYNFPGTYDVSLIVANANGVDTIENAGWITVHQQPNPSFASSINSLLVNFTDLSVGASSWSWNFGDGSTSSLQSPTHTYSSAGTYTVCLTVHNAGCGNATQCDSITVSGGGGGQAPSAAYSVSNNNVCEGNSVQFFDQSTNNPQAWSWTFQGGSPATSNLQNPTVSYSAAGTYNVTLVASNGSGLDSVVSQAAINVYASPVAAFNFIAQGLTVAFQDASSAATSWTWGFGDGSFSNASSPTYTYATPGTYQVCLTADNPACSDDLKCDSITVDSTSSSTSISENLPGITGLRIYPNPARDELFIELDEVHGDYLEIRLIDYLGKSHFNYVNNDKVTDFRKSINVTNLSSGAYIILINGAPHRIVVN
ncbi:MAG: PKD domain-containing protein [Flavobacteriales bacterium]|nr:PKD domain-containing protein [Flavobacteriales bacterium]